MVGSGGKERGGVKMVGGEVFGHLQIKHVWNETVKLTDKQVGPLTRADLTITRNN